MIIEMWTDEGLVGKFTLAEMREANCDDAETLEALTRLEGGSLQERVPHGQGWATLCEKLGTREARGE